MSDQVRFNHTNSRKKSEKMITEKNFKQFDQLIQFDVTDVDVLKKKYHELLEMNLSSEEELRVFLKKRDILDIHGVTAWSRAFILKSCDSTNQNLKKQFEHFSEKIDPIISEYEEKLNKAFLNSPQAKNLGQPFNILRRNLQSSLELFSKENIPIDQKIEELTLNVSDIQSEMMVEFNGERITIPKAEYYLKSTDRQVRKSAYDAILQVKLKNNDAVDKIFDELVTLRFKKAKNSGYENYTDYRFKELKRFEWNPKECFEFHKAVIKYLVPIHTKFNESKAKKLNVPKIKPYDVFVDHSGREPFRIFEEGQNTKMIDGVGRIVKAIDEELYDYFSIIKDHQMMDLESRANKTPGGFMLSYPLYEQVSILDNGIGAPEEIGYLLHELGHCFHYFMGKDILPFSLQDWPSEVAEAGSMSMEYMGLEELHHYLPKDQCLRLKEEKLIRALEMFIGCARGDEFQHWLYAEKERSTDERAEKWFELTKKYFPSVDYSDYEENYAKTNWKTTHILEMPFYWIDYAISEILAMTIWDKYKIDPKMAVKYYKDGCSLAASKSVNDIYKAFGTQLCFDAAVIQPIANRISNELGLA